MSTLAMVLGSVLLVFAVYAIVAPFALNYGRFTRPFRLPCPERHLNASVEVKATGAAISSAYGGRVRLRKCSLLSPGQGCDEACLKGLTA